MDTSRRQFLRGVGVAASGLWLPGCAEHTVKLVSADGQAAAGAPARVRSSTEAGPSAASAKPQEEVLLGLYARDATPDAQHAVCDLCSRLDWSWLSRGDSVLLKISSNSRHPHPAGTSPNAVRAVVKGAFDRGAGRVLVGEQCGVECTRLASGDRRYSSTRALLQQNGLYNAIMESGAEPRFFDEATFEEGYFEAQPPPGSHWREPLHLTKAVREVDHIIYLPRLCSHVLAGYTHGHKIAIGWVREDSRFHLHYKAADYHRKFVEINYTPEIRSRLRLVITLSEQIIVGGGPDHGTLGRTDCWVVLGSRHLANHEAVSVAVLAHIERETPSRLHIIPPPYGASSNLANWEFITVIVPHNTKMRWGDPDPLRYETLPVHQYRKGIPNDLALTRAYEILGGVPDQIPVRFIGHAPDAEFLRFLGEHDAGRLHLSTT